VGAVLGVDRIYPPALLGTFAVWLAVAAAIVWLAGRRRSIRGVA
jgi:hypothetical protein